MQAAIGYLKVSTQEQGRSGLGLASGFVVSAVRREKRSGALWITPPSGQDRHGVGGAGPTLIHE
jgi:hypothetical protein